MRKANEGEGAGIARATATAAHVYDSLVNTIMVTLRKGGKVTLAGLGTFSVSTRAARNDRNPQTGQTIKIKAKKVAKFKAGKELSDKL